MISSLKKLWLDILFKGNIIELEQCGFEAKLHDHLVVFSKTLAEIPASLETTDYTYQLVKLGNLELTRVSIEIEVKCEKPIPQLFINHIVPRFSTYIKGLKIEGDWAILVDVSPIEYNRARIARILMEVEDKMKLLDKDNPELSRDFVEKLMIIRSRYD